jgi:hypothetical protein
VNRRALTLTLSRERERGTKEVVHRRLRERRTKEGLTSPACGRGRPEGG